MASVACSAVSQLASVNSTFQASISLQAPARSSVRVVSVAPVRCSASTEETAVARRSMVALGAAALLASLSGSAQALGPAAEPPIEKKGRKETIKKYANICVSQPTASVCHG